MSCYYIIGVRVDNRTSNVMHFQQTLTENGCSIQARLGLHETSDDACSNDGMVILRPCGEKAAVEKLVADLNALEGITAKLIDLN